AASAGAYVATYLVDETPPQISAVIATPLSPSSARIQWTTDEPSNSHVDYGTSAGSLSLSLETSTLTTSHSVTLTALASGTTYFYRVSSTDDVNNTATSPASPAAPASFSTPVAPCAEDQA